MKVVLAEKPSVARDLASVLGANQRKQGYLEGNGWAVTWAFGHLVELQEPGKYTPEWKRWDLEHLPMLPDAFALQPRGDEGAKTQLQTVKKLFREAEGIVCATDAGREGELIFRNIQIWAKEVKKPFRRLWLQSLTPEAIKEGFAALRPGSDFDPLYQAARCRSEADWIIGLNATRFHTVRYGSRNQLWSVGRVQTPVLALLAERDREIDSFVPEPFWVLITRYRETKFTQPKKKFGKEEDAHERLEAIRNHPLVVESVEKKLKKIPPPQLYDLSSLQQDMNTWFAYTAEETLQAAQELYEAKKLTYPRTDSRHIGKEEAAGLPALLASLPEEYQSFVTQLDLKALKPGKRVVDDSKVTDHHAILPTSVSPGGLSGRQEKVYAAVVRRLLAALFPPCLQDVTTVKARVEEELFQARGAVVRDWGWQGLYPHLQKKKTQADGDQEDDNQMMPVMEEGESGPHEPEVISRMTKPPKRFTEATLLKRMETAGKLVDDEDMREAMKQRGLGTPATRAAIIETLIARKYVRRQKKQLLSTEAGRHLLTLIRDPRLLSAELTGDWEARLKEIESGKGDPEAFMEGIKEHARELVVSRTLTAEEGGLGPCPLCEGAVIEGRTDFGCSQWKQGCSFVITRDAAGATLDKALVRELLDLGHTLQAVPIKQEDGTPGLAMLHLSKNGEITAKAVKSGKKANGDKSLGTCPVCGGDVVVKPKLYVCVNESKGCPLRIWKTMAKRTITQAMVKQLLTEGITEPITDFTSKAGKPFTARLALKEGQVEMVFGD